MTIDAEPERAQLVRRVEATVQSLSAWLESRDYKGNDPYQLDAVISHAAQRSLVGPLIGKLRQVLKPYHALIPGWLFNSSRPIVIPQALGDILSAESARPPSASAMSRASRLHRLLLENRSPLARHLAWGLPFAWGGRERHPPHWPTTVTTSIVLHGLLDAESLLPAAEMQHEVEDICRFLIDEVGLIDTPDGPCFCFGPGDRRPILNASAVAASALARAGRRYGSRAHLELAAQALDFVARHQNEDGSWYYAPALGAMPEDTIIDNRHTGYMLVAFTQARAELNTLDYDQVIDRGWDFARTRLFDGSRPRWSPTETWPIDGHDVAQAIITSLALGQQRMLVELVEFAMSHFDLGGGRFRYKLLEDGRSNDSVFIRWTQAPMYKALAWFLADVAKPGPDGL